MMAPAPNYFSSVLSSIGWPSRNPNDSIEFIGFTSCASRQGTSTIAAHVAATTATEFATRTLLVDCDMERPTQHNLFQRPRAPGLADMIAANAPTKRKAQATSVANLELLSAGTCDQELLRSESPIRHALHTLTADSELVICDIPVIGSQPYAETFLALMDRVMMVIVPSETTSHELRNHRKLMARRGIAISGVVINRSKATV